MIPSVFHNNFQNTLSVYYLYVLVLCRYRGVVEAVPSRTEVQVFYSDYGNVSVLLWHTVCVIYHDVLISIL